MPHSTWVCPIACNRIYLTLETQFNKMSGRGTLKWALKGVIEISCAHDASDKNRVRLAEYLSFFTVDFCKVSRIRKLLYIGYPRPRMFIVL